MKDNVIKFGYEDTDKKTIIDLYGIEFEVKKLTNEKIEELKNIDKDDIKIFEKEIDEILGEGAVEKINNKRIADGYEKMDLQIEMAVFGCIFQAYTKTMSDSALNGITNAMNDINSKVVGLTNFNRTQRRNNYNRSNRYGKNRRY